MPRLAKRGAYLSVSVPTGVTRSFFSFWIIIVECSDPPIAEVRILVVEDDSSMRQGLCRLLESYGYQCASAADGVEALLRVRAWFPQAIIMDINMPRLDGLEATRLIKSDPATRAIPVLVLTANGSQEDQDEADVAGVSAFLTKPTNLSDLIAQLRLLAPSPTVMAT